MEPISEDPVAETESIELQDKPEEKEKEVRFDDDVTEIGNSLAVPATEVHPKGSPKHSRGISKYIKRDKKPKGERDAPEELTPTQKYVNEHIKMKLSGGEHTPTTCYGNIQFKETTKRATGRFIRCADDTDQEKLFNLFTEHWKVEKPRLLISVTGGAMSFDLAPRLKKDFQEGLLKVASTPGAWVVSGGTNTGVMKLVGDANHGTTNVCIGIVTWGIVAKRDTLQPTSESEEKVNKMLGTEQRRSGETFPYRLGSYLVQKGEAFLDYNHTHFILVDDGSVGKWGREIGFRGKFEEYLIQHKPGGAKIPSVLLVLEGGPGTLNTVYEAVKNSIPCVIIEGSGRAADVLVYAYNFADQILESEEDGKLHDGLVIEIMRVFNLKGPDDRGKVMNFKDTIVKCIKKKDVFTIANMRTGMDTDDAILTALLKDTSTAPSHYEQMRLAILWDRVDLAETRIMSKVCGSWMPKEPKGKPSPDLSPEEKKDFLDRQSAAAQHELNELMIMALAMDKVGFVKLLLGYGVSIKSLLTKQILQYLYAYRRNLGLSTMRYELRTKNMENPDSKYASFFKHLQEYADTRKGRKKKTEIQEIRLEEIRKHLGSVLRSIPEKIIENVVEIPEESVIESGTFKSPFRQLFIWAVFNNMLDMALMLWEFEDDAICKALIAAEMTNGLIRKIRYRDLQDEVEKSLEASFNAYQKLSLDLLDLCYKTHEKNTELLITMRLDLLNEQSSCLDFAVTSEQRDFVSHSCVQGILNDVWTGSITQRHIGGFKVCAYIFCPFLLYNLEIRTRSEMKKMINCAHFDEEDESMKLGSSRRSRGSIDIGKRNRAKEQQLARMDTMDREEEKINERKRLPFIKKLYYFHVYSPVVRFYMHTMGYLLFLMLFAYVATVKKVDNVPTGLEILLIITVVGYAASEIYQMMHIDAPSVGLKLKDYVDDIWNQFDILCLLVFIIAIILRCIPSTVEYGHLFYTFDVSLWIIRLINILYVDPVAGPYVVMIGHMFTDLMNFVLILVIFLLAYGIAVKGILEPTPDNAQMFIASIFKPYFHWHGEYFLDAPEDENTTYFGTEKHNSYAEPIALIYMALYLLIVNILLLNLVIAIFNSTYERIMSIATRVWKFQRYGLIVEYAQRRSVFYPPFSLIFHFYLFIRWLLSLCSCTRVKPHAIETGLKPQGEIKKQKKSQLRELESNCLIKLVRKRRRVDDLTSDGTDNSSTGANGSAGHGMHRSELEKKFTDQQAKQENMESKLVEKLEALLQKDVKDEEMEKIKQSLNETLDSQKDELKTLKKLRKQSTVTREISVESEAKYAEEIRALKEEIQKLQIDNRIYLQDIGRKRNLLKEKDREIEELKEEIKESYETSGVEN